MKAPSVPNGRDFVQEVIDGLQRRSKSIKHSGATLEWDRVKEIDNGVERAIGRLDINVSYRISSSAVRVRLIVWADRWIWMDARRTTKAGWAWEMTMQGRFLGQQGARDLVRKLEETINVTWNADAQIPRLIKQVWERYLALGPKRL